MNTELKSAVMATDRDAQYDNSAKRLIAHKIILARILIKTVEKFKGMDPLEVTILRCGTFAAFRRQTGKVLRHVNPSVHDVQEMVKLQGTLDGRRNY